MALQFQHVFAGEGVRGGKEQRNAPVQGLAYRGPTQFGTTGPDAGSTAPDSAVTSPHGGGAGYLAPCAQDSDCSSTLCREVEGRLIANIAPTGVTPVVTVSRLEELGFSAAIFPASRFQSRGSPSAVTASARAGTASRASAWMATRASISSAARQPH